jgi:hypothetical protein
MADFTTARYSRISLFLTFIVNIEFNSPVLMPIFGRTPNPFHGRFSRRRLPAANGRFLVVAVLVQITAAVVSRDRFSGGHQCWRSLAHITDSWHVDSIVYFCLCGWFRFAVRFCTTDLFFGL